MDAFRQVRPKILLMMKLTTVFLLVTFMSVSASSMAQGTTIKVENATLQEVFKEIRQKMGYTFVYNEAMVNRAGAVTVDVTSDDIKEVLDACLRNTSLGYYLQDDVVVIVTQAESIARAVQQESFKITGKVTDEKGESLPGVTIVIKGTTLGTATNETGDFTLDVPKMDSVVLVFSFVGMKSHTEVIRDLKQDMKPLKIVLEEEAETLKDVVVTGIFDRKKEGFTGSAVTVSGEDLKRISTTNMAKALAALDPSFRIMEDVLNGSNPNRLPDLRMRGQATLPGAGTVSSGLVALQGEYETYPNQPLLIMDGFEISLQTFVDLDPDRVESITLLKDAAATAIYGSRAANGVIVIESKTPKEGRLWVTYGGNIRLETPDLSDYNLMNAAEKLEAERIAGMYNTSTGPDDDQLYNDKLREVKRGVNTYWLDEPLRTAVQHRHSLTFEGGDRALRYRLYAGINNTPGVMKGSKRNTISASLDLQYRFKNVLLSNSVTVDNAVGDESPYGEFSEYTRLNPYLRSRGENGKILKNLDSFMIGSSSATVGYANPLYNTQFNTKNRTTSFSVREQFSLEYNPTDEIRLVGQFSLTKGTGKTEVFRPAQHTAFDTQTNPEERGDFRRTQMENLSYQLDLRGSYNTTFNTLHYLTANLQMSLLDNSDESYTAYVTGFPNDNMDDILFGRKYDEQMQGAENTTRSIGWVGSFGYSYNYKYSVDFNIRLDGSSVFGEDNRWAPFWSTGVRWDLKKEHLVANWNFISDLVFRASYGVTGTQGFAPYQSQELYSYGNLLRPYVSSDGVGAELVAMPNNKLKWQETDNWNFALELGLLKSRITARLEYFKKITKNSLTDITLAPSLGFSSFPDNMGTLENKGFEFNVSFIPYQNPAANGYWTITFNGSHSTDKLTKISEALRAMNERNNAGQEDTPLPHYEEGESINRIWVVRSLGIDPATGEEILLKRNGEMTNDYDVVDLVPYGTTEPDWQGNINSSFAYKGFGVDLSLAYKFGGQVYNSTLVDKVENADLRYNADKRVLELRWQKPGDKAMFKKLEGAYSGSNTKATSRFVMDENTLQMTSLSMSYRMDKTNAKYIERWGLSSVKVAFNMEDLFYISTVKRERGLSYPFARQFSFSLNVAF